MLKCKVGRDCSAKGMIKQSSYTPAFNCRNIQFTDGIFNKDSSRNL